MISLASAACCGASAEGYCRDDFPRVPSSGTVEMIFLASAARCGASAEGYCRDDFPRVPSGGSVETCFLASAAAWGPCSRPVAVMSKEVWRDDLPRVLWEVCREEFPRGHPRCSGCRDAFPRALRFLRGALLVARSSGTVEMIFLASRGAPVEMIFLAGTCYLLGNGSAWPEVKKQASVERGVRLGLED